MARPVYFCGPPAVFDKVNGQETWSYLKKKTAPLDPLPATADATGRFGGAPGTPVP